MSVVGGNKNEATHSNQRKPNLNLDTQKKSAFPKKIPEKDLTFYKFLFEIIFFPTTRRNFDRKAV